MTKKQILFLALMLGSIANITLATKKTPTIPIPFMMNTKKDEFHESLPIYPSEFDKTGIVNYIEKDYSNWDDSTALWLYAQNRQNARVLRMNNLRRLLSRSSLFGSISIYEYESQCLAQDLDAAINETGTIGKELSKKQLKIIQALIKRDSYTYQDATDNNREYHDLFLDTDKETPCIYCPNIESRRYKYDSAIIIGTQDPKHCEQLRAQVAQENTDQVTL